jgi:hypothetical protein
MAASFKNKNGTRGTNREEYDMTNVTCIGCGKSPEALSEYRDLAKLYKITATEFVKSYEGTFNRFQSNKFYCTTCYINACMPVYKSFT